MGSPGSYADLDVCDSLFCFGAQCGRDPPSIRSPNVCTSETRRGGLGLLSDLHGLYLLTSHLDMAWMLVGQAAMGARDHELIRAVDACAEETEAQQDWLTTRLKAAAPQALLVAD
jgi:hypothetical protein